MGLGPFWKGSRDNVWESPTPLRPHLLDRVSAGRRTIPAGDPCGVLALAGSRHRGKGLQARLRGLKRPDVISPVPEGCVKSRGSQGAGCGRERRRERTRGHGAPKPKPKPRGGTWGGAAPAGGWCMWRGGRAKGGEVRREGGEAHRPGAGAQLVLSVFPGGAGAPVAPWAQGTRRTMKSDWGPWFPWCVLSLGPHEGSQGGSPGHEQGVGFAVGSLLL